MPDATPQPRPDSAGLPRSASGLALPLLAAASLESGLPRTADLATGPPPVVSFVSLGCAKNLVDSEKMLGQVAESGALISSDESAADTIVVNTCGFLESSRDEAFEILEELAERKRAGRLRRLVVAGCLVQRDGERIRQRVPEVDVLVGVNNRDDIVRAVWRAEHDAATSLFLGDYYSGRSARWSDQGRMRLTPRHYAYVRVSEGCNQKCTFCTIPSIRGPLRSKTRDELVAECRELCADGASELILIGQDTTSYGMDLAESGGLAELLRTLSAQVTEARWLRLMYVYPSILTDEMLDAIAESERIVKYVDIPLQHVNDRMLKRMNRGVNRDQTEALLERIRRRIPGVSIRTTFIVGFPGETGPEFEELLEFVRSFGFDAAGAFKYSREADTPAGRMTEQIDSEIVSERHERFMLAQQEIAFEATRRFVGKTFDVLVDSREDFGNVARHAGQAPEVDATCLIPDGELRPGQFARVRCSGTDDYDLVVRPARARRNAR